MQKQVKSPVCVAAKGLLLKLYGCINLLPYILGYSGDADSRDAERRKMTTVILILMTILLLLVTLKVSHRKGRHAA